VVYMRPCSRRIQESAEQFDDSLEAKGQFVSKIPRLKIGVRGFEPPVI